jgi:hypothetical protein
MKHGGHHPSPTQKVLNVWGIVVTIWAVYRATIGREAPMEFDEFIFKPLLFIWPVLYFVRVYEKRNLVHGLWLSTHKLKDHVMVSIVLSIPLVGFLLAMIFSGALRANADIPLAVLYAFAMTMTEETISRGFVATRIFEETRSYFSTILQASILHIFLRVPRLMTNPELLGDRLLQAASAEILLSFALTGVLLWRKSLVPVYVLRFFYSFVLLALI